MSDEDKGLEALRKPFPASVIGKLPRQGTTLDYVGHAAVTDRLLTVDPHWTWEPVALDEHGLPLYDRAGGLWIRLTVCGVTRLGYGDGPDPKQRIGDAIRNAAMRFGVALDLWTKGELESQDPNGGGGDTVQDFQRKAERNQRAEANRPAEPWEDVKVKRPPVVTDPAWLKDISTRIASAETIPDVRKLRDEAKVEVVAGKVADADANDLLELIEERVTDLTKTATMNSAGAAVAS